MQNSNKNPMDIPINRTHVSNAIKYLYHLLPDADGLAYINAEGENNSPIKYAPTSNCKVDDFIEGIAKEPTFTSMLQHADHGYRTIMSKSSTRRYVCVAVRHKNTLIGALILFAGYIPESSIAMLRASAVTIEAMLSTQEKA